MSTSLAAEKEQAQQDLDRMRHSTAHLMAAAVQLLWPEAKFGVGPAIKNGFYYDIELPEALTPKDLGRIEQKMRELKNKKLGYDRIEVGIDEAIEEMSKRNQPYKVELLNLLKERGSTAVVQETGDAEAIGLSEGQEGSTVVSFYQTGHFLDLCRGPHVEDTTHIGVFKLMSIAGAYWRGNENNPQLQRLYGTAFNTKEELDHYLWLLEESKKRDHRRLGQELDLFAFSDLVGGGLPLFTPKGTLVRDLLEEFVQSLQEPLGYQRVHIPHITKNDLYKTSGHWEKFQEDIFHVSGKSGEDFCMKPMNCPHHTQIYASRMRSYRELPIRLSEVTTVYRDELPGTLHGLSRVRAITQDDAHVFCTPDQVQEEVLRIYSIIENFYKPFGMTLAVRLSLWDEEHPEKYLGTPELWNSAQEQLRAVLRMKGIEWVEEVGEAAFYGPKIDFTALDALERTWQLATIQLDFNLPERFNLEYMGPDGHAARPVMLHRAVLGSVERFMSVLIEHYAGAFPTWLSPVQAMIIPIADRHLDYAYQVKQSLLDVRLSSARESIRVEVDEARESMQKKIRNAQLQKVPYMLVLGDKEAENGEVNVRHRSGVNLGTLSVSALAERIKQEILTRNDLPRE
ncbi:threonine--tRNA ligase [Ktedonobacter racemifer]|uniref:Threonine--tRNA ligase n=1 Tax=Ktedonobacter racemifer DSM 44963 TaxID=485913 RepID=D6U1H7_KTERA|nr:threonine--tRNA ligase [Ktedonobacter racemifer]EFH82621.1 threonyl-tRNA synthetase [Ktedonobacter racemifer DSM 44963]